MSTSLVEALQTGSLASEILATASVSERFVPADLLAGWMRRHPGAGERDVLEAMELTLDLETLGTAALTRDGNEAIGMLAAARQQLLALLGRDGALRKLAEKGSLTLTEASFRQILEGEQPALTDADGMTLLALETAVDWARSTGVATLPDAADIQAERLRRDFLDAIGGSELRRFVGREGFLATLKQIWRLGPETRESVLVEGPGGMGKSLAIARFISLMLDYDDEAQRPQAVFVLDYERLDLQAARPSTILAEMERQLTRWWLPGYEPVTEMAVSPFSSLVLESVSDAGRGTEAIRDLSLQAYMMASAINGASKRQPRLIVFADTFEEVDAFDDSAMLSVREACAVLRSAGADVMEIYAGRHFRTPRQLALRQRPIHLKLGRMTQGEVLRYLRQEAAARGIRLSKQTADTALRKLKGWPLDIRLAVALMPPEGQAFDQQQWLADLASSSMRRQATLYDRVLKRLRDKDLRKLAKPGLLLRRLTAPLIAQVLAGPCGIDLDQTGGERLLRKAADMGQLFVTDPSDPGAVWHRHDIRSLMFGDLVNEIEPEVARAIHAAAVEYYAALDGPENRAEELYHRLQLGQGPDLLEPRWEPNATARLKRAMNELPVAGQDWLRPRLGGARIDLGEASGGPASAAGGQKGMPGEARSRADDRRMDELRLAARKRFQGGDWEVSDILLSAGVAESAATPLGDIYVQSLIHNQLADKAIQEALLLRSNRRPLPLGLRSSIYASVAGVFESDQRWEEALEFWAAAARAGVSLAPIDRLSFQIGKMRTLRHQGLMRRRSAMLAPTHRMLEVVGLSIIDRRVLARETVAELADSPGAYMDFHAPGLLVEVFAKLCGLDEAFIHASVEADRRITVARRLGLSPQASQREINSVAARIVGTNGMAREELVSIIREEVDWSIRQTTAANAVSHKEK